MLYSLQNYTTYSIKSGIGQPEDWVEQAVELGYQSLGICDKGTFAAAIEFQKDCEKAGIQPILGEEFLVTNDVSVRDKKKKSNVKGILLIYAKDEEGLKNLIGLNNFSTDKDRASYYRPRIDIDTLEQFKEGLICVVPTEDGFGRDTNPGLAKLSKSDSIYRLNTIFGDDLYIGLNPLTSDIDAQRSNEAVVEAFGDTLKYVFTFNAHWPKETLEHLYEVVRGMDKGSHGQAKNLDRKISFGHMPSYDDVEVMIDSYNDSIADRFDECLENLQEISEKCTAKIELGTYHMPEMETETDTVEGDILKAIGEGFKKKLLPTAEFKGDILEDLDELDNLVNLSELYAHEHINRGEIVDGKPKPLFEPYLKTLDTYVDRLKYELRIIKQLGYLEYFHLVRHLCIHIDKVGLGRAPARGSAAGSLVSYLLNITKVDPLRHNLIFERFLNPDRQDLPDIDLDFSVEAREEIKRYVREKWGEDKVCNIGAFGRLKIPSAVTKIASVDNYSIPDNNGHYVQYTSHRLTSMMKETEAPATFRGEKELRERLASSKDFQSFYDLHSDWFANYVLPLQDMVLNTQVHAAGTLITKRPLYEHIPTYEHSSGERVSQWPDRNCEEAGNPKFDFLTVEGVNVVEFATQLIKARHGIDVPQVEEIPLDDERTMAIFTKGDTRGLHQFRSYLQRWFFPRLAPTVFPEIAAAAALIRPGPMGADAHEDFIAIKHGKKEAEYDHPDLEHLLSDTYGLLIYQEQVMAIAVTIAGFTGAEADYLRKAAGKKILKDMEKWETNFKEGGLNNGYDEELLDTLWDKIITFAEYGFNKCLTGDTELQVSFGRSDCTESWTIEELQYLKQDPDDNLELSGIFAVQRDEETGLQSRGQVVDIHYNGVKRVYNIETASGNVIRATLGHKLLAFMPLERFEYREVAKLEVDDYLVSRDSEGSGFFPDRIVSIAYIGAERTYDVEMADPYHNFIANDIVSHNSHSISYTLLSWQQAYIKARWPVEFWCAVLKYSSDDSSRDSSPQKLKALVKENGVKIVYPTIHGFAPDFEPAEGEDEIYWPLRGVSGIGDAVCDEMCKDGRRSFESIEDMIENTNSRKVHKGIVCKLIQAGFFDPLGKPWEVAKEYFAIRKANGRSDKGGVPPDLRHKNLVKWNMAKNEVYKMIVTPWKETGAFHENVQSYPGNSMMRLRKNQKVFIGGLVESIWVNQTKNGGWYGRMTVVDEGEEHTVLMWPGFFESNKFKGKDDDGRYQRPYPGQLIEMLAYKDDYNDKPQVVAGQDNCYLRIIWDELDELREKYGDLS